MDEVIEPKVGCIAAALTIIGDKWSGLIIRELTSGAKRFSMLESALSGISPRTLSQRLDSLEEHQIIAKKVFAKSPPRIEYSLTPRGEDLMPILQSMVEWGAKYSMLSIDPSSPKA